MAALPPALPAPTVVTADTELAAEARDPAWADATEAELRRRLREIRGARLEGTECRRTLCRLTFAGSEAEIGDAIAALEHPRGGLVGFASNLVLTAPERTAEGALVLRAFARFERPE